MTWLNEIHRFLRRADGSFAERAEVRLKEPNPEHKCERGTTRPDLVDWNGDGHTELVVAHRGSWTLAVALSPLADKMGIGYQPTKPVKLPPIDGAPNPIHFAFADWDGDGRMDLLVGVDWGRAGGQPPRRYSVYWFRNTSDTGPPRFAEAAPLLDIPDPWILHAFAAVDWGGEGRPSLAVSVSNGWKLGEGGRGRWPVTSELWLYGRKAAPRAAPDPAGM